MEEFTDLTALLAIFLESEDDDERKVRIMFEVALARAKNYRKQSRKLRA